MKRVLVVDDEPVIRSLVEASLAGPDCQVVSVADGVSALRAVDSERPDLILLDLGLPGMAGHEVASRLRSRHETAGIPIVYLTGLEPSGDRGPADGVIAKPFTPASLRQSTAAWL